MNMDERLSPIAKPADAPKVRAQRLPLPVLIIRNCLLVGIGLALAALVFGSVLRPLLAAVNVNEEVTALLTQWLFAAIPPALYLTIGFTARQGTPKRAGALAIALIAAAAVYGLTLLWVALFPSPQAAQGQPSLEMTFAQAEAGVIIESIVAGSAAEQAGLLVGDIITAIRREAVDLGALQTRITEEPLGTPFRLRVQRAGEELQVTVPSVAATTVDTNAIIGRIASNLAVALALAAFGFLVPYGWMPYVLLCLTLLPLLLGYTWLIVATFSQETNGLLPVTGAGTVGGLTLENWSFLTREDGRGSIWTYTFNSFAIAVIMTAALLLLCSMAAYALSRMEFAGRRLFLSFTLILHGFPAVTLLIPIYIVLLNLGALPLIGDYIGFNTLGGIALVEIAFGLPFGVWLMKGFFDNISWDMERSALIDGASRWRTFWEIILPQIRPGLFALGIFSFVGGWNTYLIPATFSVGTRVSNLPVYIQQLLGETNPVNWNEIAAIGLFQMIPIIILFVFAQEYLLNIYGGGSKGSS
jgi:inositol-phosphate transport system permease protein